MERSSVVTSRGPFSLTRGELLHCKHTKNCLDRAKGIIILLSPYNYIALSIQMITGSPVLLRIESKIVPVIEADGTVFRIKAL